MNSYLLQIRQKLRLEFTKLLVEGTKRVSSEVRPSTVHVPHLLTACLCLCVCYYILYCTCATPTHRLSVCVCVLL